MRRTRRDARVVARADPRSTSAFISPLLAAALQVRAELLGLRRQAIESSAYCAAWCSAAWRLLRCNPWSHGGYDPVEDQRLFRRRAPARRSLIHASSFANILQPLIDVFEAVLVFFHDTVGLSWGCSIIALTVVVRAALLPLTLQADRSMQALQELAPQIKELQAKYKDDKQRLKQEMMKFYQENKVNPLASCLPLVAQLPVFISLFYMLRTDLKHDICPASTQSRAAARPERYGTPASRRPGSAQLPLHPGPDRQGDGRGADHADRALRRHPARLDADDVGHAPTRRSGDLHRAAAHLRHLHHQLPGRPDRLLDHDEHCGRSASST